MASYIYIVHIYKKYLITSLSRTDDGILRTVNHFGYSHFTLKKFTLTSTQGLLHDPAFLYLSHVPVYESGVS